MIVCIAEKPSVARDIAHVLGATASHEGYLDVELRHNSGSDLAGYTQWYYVSFDLTPIAPLLEGKQGVTLKIKTQQNGTKYLRLERNSGSAAQ